jgi:phage terminase large subunit-like protein
MIRKSDIKYGEYNEIRGWKNRVIVSNNDSVIYIKTYEQGAAAFQGDDIDVVWLDEEPPWDVFSEIVIRLADRKGILIATFTSLQGFTRLVNRVWQSSDPNIKTCVLTAQENPFLTEEAKKQLYDSIDPDERASRWDGQPHIKQGLIYKGYNSEDHRIKRFDYAKLILENPTRWELHEGIDPHERTPHHWLRFLYDRSNDIVYIVEELKAPTESMLISDYARLIKMKRDKLIPRFTQIDTSSMKPDVIVAHPDEDQENAHTIRMEFLRCGIETILVTKDNAIGIEAVKGRLKIVRTADGTIKRGPTLKVFDDLVGVHFEFTRYSWDSFSSDRVSERRELINTPLKKNDHFMDIIKYEAIKLKSEKYRDDSEFISDDELFDGTGY